MKLGCVILAAGQARRFGSNKLLTPLGGRPMLSYVLDMLPRDRFVKVMAVVSNPETERLCRECGIESLRYSGGPQSDSIRLGVGAMKEMDGCLFVMGDQPLCTGASVEKMLDTFVLDPGHVYRLSFGDTQASPVLFPKDTFDGLSKLTGERGGMAVARTYPGGICPVEAGDQMELWDADTPQALAALEQYLR